MRNLYLFIRRYSNFFLFLFLQGVALWFLFSFNRFHHAKFLGIANEATGRINAQYNKLESYFHLKEENRKLHRYNDSLLNERSANYAIRDTSAWVITDSVRVDSILRYRRYIMRPATVIYNTVNAQKNYFQLNRGAKQGIRDNMAVITSDGKVAGVVINTSPNFSQAMSLLHVQTAVSVALKKSGELGTVEWDGKSPDYLLLKRIPKNVPVQNGDTVVTSPVSFNFPPGYMVGTVSDIKTDNASGLYILKLRTAANFYSLQQVHVIENTDYDEQVKLNEDTRKKTEQVKKTPR